MGENITFYFWIFVYVLLKPTIINYFYILIKAIENKNLLTKQIYTECYRYSLYRLYFYLRFRYTQNKDPLFKQTAKNRKYSSQNLIFPSFSFFFSLLITATLIQKTH